MGQIFKKEKIFCENIKLDEDLFIGGNKEDIREFNCVICLQIVDLPIACNKCESLMCTNCIDVYLKINEKCPKCKENYSKKTINRILMNILNRSEFKCPLNCKEIVSYEKYKKHLEICENLDEKVTCIYCKEIVYLNEDFNFFNHEDICNQLKANCPFCDICVKKIEYPQHLDICEKGSFICDKCNKVILIKYKSHHDDYFCNEFIEIKEDLNGLIDKLK